jgi:predicted phosphodiesterase
MRTLQDIEPLTPKASPEHVRLVVLSDTHGKHRDVLSPLPEGDVLIHLGDVANRGSLTDIRSFVEWTNIYRHKFPEIVIIEGNHDRDLNNPGKIQLEQEYKDFIYLQDEYRELAGGQLKVFGASWDSCERDDYSHLKQPVDILLTHYHPHVRRAGFGWKGSRKLSRLVTRYGIPLHIFGHAHVGRGVRLLTNGSIMVNCCTQFNLPVVIDWDPEARKVVLVHCPKPTILNGRFCVTPSSITEDSQDVEMTDNTGMITCDEIMTEATAAFI